MPNALEMSQIILLKHSSRTTASCHCSAIAIIVIYSTHQPSPPLCRTILVVMGIYEQFPPITMAPEPATKQDQLVSTIRPLISNFLETIDYDPPSKPDKAALRAAMTEYAAPSGVPYKEDKHSRQCFETGLSVAIVSPGILTLHPPSLRCSPVGLHCAVMRRVHRAKWDLSAYALFSFLFQSGHVP